MFNGESEGPQARFAVRRWAACAAGLEGEAAWREWSRRPWVPTGDSTPPLAAMAPMLRRRLNRLGRIALQAAWDCQGEEIGMPIVFASRYGDAARSLALLEDLVSGQEVSPTGFNMSVHNAIGALYAIARADRSNAVSVAAGRASAGAGLLEAAALLADGAPEVMLVCYDAPLPGAWHEFETEPAAPYAWAWLMAPAADAGQRISLDWEPAVQDDEAQAGAAPSPLPFGLDAMRFMLSGDASWQRACEGRRWQWSRHASRHA